MTKRDFFTPLVPTETAARITQGRKDLELALQTPSLRGGVDNDVEFSGAYMSKAGDYDKFLVTTNGSANVTDADLRLFKSLGCDVESMSGRIAIVRKKHAAYDTRWFKVDMSTPQCCMVTMVVVLAAMLLAGAMGI